MDMFNDSDLHFDVCCSLIWFLLTGVQASPESTHVKAPLDLCPPISLLPFRTNAMFWWVIFSVRSNQASVPTNPLTYSYRDYVTSTLSRSVLRLCPHFQPLTVEHSQPLPSFCNTPLRRPAFPLCCSSVSFASKVLASCPFHTQSFPPSAHSLLLSAPSRDRWLLGTCMLCCLPTWIPD